EQTPVIEGTINPTSDNSSNFTSGGDATLQSEQIVQGTNYKADKVLITPENLTVLLRGLDESNKVNTMLIIDQYINTVVQERTPINITGSKFVDAEKYSTGTPGFDSQHCWAATASNVLWTTGYAQKAINPQTGNYFMNEDEVLAYFTANFTDNPGDPEDGVNWFMKGTGAYNESQVLDGVAHYTDVNSGGLLRDVSTSSSILTLWNGLWDAGNPEVNKGTPDTINSLLSVCTQGMGVLVKWYENNAISNSAHWMTVVGTIIDTTTNVLADKYKALIVADSDSDPVHREAGVNFEATTFGQKLVEKANSVNAYTIYKLEFVPQLNGNGAWRLVGFGENANKIAVVSHLYYLFDSDKSPQGEPGDSFDRSQVLNNNDFQYSTEGILTINAEDNYSQSSSCQTPVAHENNDSIVISDGQNAIIITKEDILNAFSEAELEVNENLVRLLEYMNDNKIEIFSRAKGIVSIANGDNYVAYIKTPTTRLTVSVDGIILPEDVYEVIVLPNGIIKIKIKNSYLKTLSIGTHNLQINVEGVEPINSSLYVAK
ncbi:MAG: hypothetical protein Q4D29_12045, partial [Lachnospiraceae bacterium]|nr:hypothetical protein [Lachnospiraceae bacterium]